MLLVIISFIVKEPYSQLILFGLIVESTTLLPIFSLRRINTMETLVNLFLKFFTSIMEFVGLVAGANPCAAFMMSQKYLLK